MPTRRNRSLGGGALVASGAVPATGESTIVGGERTVTVETANETASATTNEIHFGTLTGDIS